MDIGKYTFNAAQYSRYRMEYPQEFIDYLYSDTGLTTKSVIADIGSGTGKLSRLLLLKGSRVYCVEPDDGMRGTAEKELSAFSNVTFVKATAEDTTLPDVSVDFVTAGTAFHWFDTEKFKKECQRILRPDGKVILVWISRPVNRNVLFEINYNGISGGKEEKPELITPFFKDDCCEYKVFQEKAVYDKDAFIGRALSAFNRLTGEEYINELSVLFDRHAVNDAVEVTLYTRCYIGLI